MAASLIEFVNSNQNRAYPLDDRATQVADNGMSLPENFLIDCHIWWPLQTGSRIRLMLSSITVTSSLVTATFSATDGTIMLPAGGPFNSGPTQFDIPVASIAARLPVIPGRPQAVNGLISGVGGWVSFGEGVNSSAEANLKFTLQTQSLLVADAAVEYSPASVTNLGKLNDNNLLHGLVKLEAGSDINIVKATRIINGVSKEAAVISLDRNFVTLDRMKKYIGPCLGSPEGGTCSEQPIFEIAGVPPSCLGNITINVQTAESRTIDNESGIVIQPKFDLSDLCPAVTGGQITVTGALSLPFLESFNSPLTASSSKLGDFALRLPDAFIQEDCQMRSSAELQNMATLEVNSREHQIHTTVRLTATTKRNAYILFGWHSNDTYWYAGIEQETVAGTQNRILIGKVTRGIRTIVVSNNVSVLEEVNYDLDFTTDAISPTVTRMTLSVPGLGTIQQVTSLFNDGRIGAYTDDAISYFDNYSVDWTDTYPPVGSCLLGPYAYSYACGYTTCGTGTLIIAIAELMPTTICGILLKNTDLNLTTVTPLPSDPNAYFGSTASFTSDHYDEIITTALVTFNPLKCSYDVTFSLSTVETVGGSIVTQEVTITASNVYFVFPPEDSTTPQPFTGTTSCNTSVSMTLGCSGTL